MSDRAEAHAFRAALTICQRHHQALREALSDMRDWDPTGEDLSGLDKHKRRLLDQFAYRYTRLQDDMGMRLFPAALKALAEDVAAMPVLDRLNRLEQLGWLPSAEEWQELRRIRNEFTHEYPEPAENRRERLELALQSAKRLPQILERFETKASERQMI